MCVLRASTNLNRINRLSTVFMKGRQTSHPDTTEPSNLCLTRALTVHGEHRGIKGTSLSRTTSVSLKRSDGFPLHLLNHPFIIKNGFTEPVRVTECGH